MRKKKPIHKRKTTQGKRKATKKRRAPVDSQVMEDVAVEPTRFEATPLEPAGLGPDAAGQSGDIEGLSTLATGDSESVAELVEEGQALEAESVEGVENAPDPDEAEVRTHEQKK